MQPLFPIQPLFTPAGTWDGGFFELVIELPHQGEATTRRALAALWRMPQLTGCYARRDVEPTQQQPLNLAEVPVEGNLYGVATLPNGARCACGSYTIHFEGEASWLGLYLPYGALTEFYSVGGYPFAPIITPSIEHNLKVVHEWFRTLAEGLYEHFAFTLGVIGFETEFEKVKARTPEAIPAERLDGLLIPSGIRLLWYPPTRY